MWSMNSQLLVVPFLAKIRSNSSIEKQRISFPHYAPFSPTSPGMMRMKKINSPNSSYHHSTLPPPWLMHSMHSCTLIYWHFLLLTFLCSHSSVLMQAEVNPASQTTNSDNNPWRRHVGFPAQTLVRPEVRSKDRNKTFSTDNLALPN